MKHLRLLTAFMILLLSCVEAAERGSSWPYISGDTFREFCDHIYDETSRSLSPKEVKSGDVVFVKTDYLNTFFKTVHKKIKHPYILLSHNSDDHMPGRFTKYLDDEKLIAWFGQNFEGPFHEKLHPIPIGIANKCWAHGNTEKIRKVEKVLPKISRDILLYMNFAVGTCFKERKHVAELFKNKKYCVSESPKEYSKYLRELSRAKFVLSPRGNGLDCHRTWEALLLGAIPIVRSSTLDRMYEDLPVLIIDKWEEITPQLLNQTYEQFGKRQFHLEKKFFDYWWKKIDQTRKHYLDNH